MPIPRHQSGLETALYISCLRQLLKRRKDTRSGILLFAYITILFALQLLFVVNQSQTVEWIYIDNRNFPSSATLAPASTVNGGPWAFFLERWSDSLDLRFCATFFLLTFLANALFVSILHG
jgi:hypothetical protein